MTVNFNKTNIPEDSFRHNRVALDIAVNTRLLLKNRLEGLGTFTHETFSRLVKSHPEHRFHFLFDRGYDEMFLYGSNVVPHVIPPQARHSVLFYIWFEWSVASRMKKVKPALYISPDGYLSLRSPVPQIPVIHDLNFHHFPQYFKKSDLDFYLRNFPKYALKATRIATVSEFSKKDIQELYGIPGDKIDVVYNGVDDDAFYPVEPALQQKTRESLTGGDPYFVFVGGLYPRKNLVNLVKAFGIFKSREASPMKLVLGGSANKNSQELMDTIAASSWKNEIILPGRIEPVSRLREIIGSAYAMTYVSSFEGFGIPVIEAQKCGVPVLSADNSSLPEVAGEAALFVDHSSPESIADGMQKLWKDPALCETLREKGRTNASRFSWDRTAQLMWDCIEKTLAVC